MSNTIKYDLTEDEAKLVAQLKSKFTELQALLDLSARVGIEVKIDPLRGNAAEMFANFFGGSDERKVKNPHLSWSISKVVFVEYPIEHSKP